MKIAWHKEEKVDVRSLYKAMFSSALWYRHQRGKSDILVEMDYFRRAYCVRKTERIKNDVERISCDE